MSLKKLTSDTELYADFLDHLDASIAQHQKQLETYTDQVLIYRTQGAIMALRKLKMLKEALNGKHS